MSIILIKLFGFWGTCKYFSFHKINKAYTFLLSSLFVNSNWFALHFSEGHVVFRTFFLIPLVFYYFENLISRKNLLILGALLLFLILDGGFYPLIFSFVYFLIKIFLDKANRDQLFYFVKQNFSFFFLSIAGFSLVSLVKIFPVILNSENLKDIQETINLNSEVYLEMFFNPFKNNEVIIFDYLRFHEFGSYIGFSLIFLFIFQSIKNYNQVKNLIHLLLIMIIFFWIGTGMFGNFNPYQIISKIPIIKKAHVQSRYLILFLLFFILFLGKLLTHSKASLITLILLLVANVEFIISNQFAFNPNMPNYDLQMITRNKWTRTDFLVHKPSIYYTEGLISKICYEPAQTFTETLHSQQPSYQGEFMSLKGQIFLSAVTLTPGEINFNYSSPKGGDLVLNTHFLDGWIETNLNAKTFEINKLLAVKLPAGEGNVRLQFFPFYYNYIFFFAIVGLFLIIYLMRKKL